MTTDDILRRAIKAQAEWNERDAINMLVEALRSNPKEARLHQMLGALEHSLDNSENALRHFTRALALAPTNHRIAYALAQARYDAGHDAREDFERALALSPQDRDIRLGKIAACLAGDETAVAETKLEQWLTADPDWTQGHNALVRLRWQAGQGNAAWRTLGAMVRERPRNLALWRELILGLMHARKYSEALKVISRGRELHGPDLLFASSEAGCLDELGDLDRAERVFLSIGRQADVGLALRFTRHLLKSHRPADAVAVAQAWIGQPGAQNFWPYIATAWRILEDPRWQWLEGDERFVATYDLTDQIGPINDLANYLRGLHGTQNQPLDQSLRGGTQTNGKLFSRSDPIIQRLRQAIAGAVERHLAQLPKVDPDHPTLSQIPDQVRFSGSWSVRLTDRGHHAAHMHPQGSFSSAFYVALPENMDATEKNSGWLTLGEQPEFADCPPAFREIKPHVGMLVLFPSTMWHGTRPIGNGERLTVAFDVSRPPPGHIMNMPAGR